jgi:hypothetical protein
MGWRWAGRQPSWYLSWSERLPATLIRFMRRLRRKPRRRTIAGDWPLARFLDGTVEPAAVLLFWSARIAGSDGRSDAGVERVKQALRGPAQHEQARPPDRRAYSAADYWIENYLLELAGSRGGERERPAWRRFVGWIGASKHRARREPNSRIEYDLACLFSRLAHAERDTRGSTDEALLDRAANHLERSLSALMETRRKETADWASRDPSLDDLRQLGGERFRRALSQSAEPRPLDTARIRGVRRVLFRLAAPIPALVALTLVVVGRAADFDLVTTVGWILLAATIIVWIVGGVALAWSSLHRTIAG